VESLVDVAKLPASTSHIHQPADVATTFRAAQKSLQSIIKNDEDTDNPILEKELKNVMCAITKKYKCKGAAITQKVVGGILKIVKALGGVVNRKSIIQSFKDCGQYPLDIKRMFGQAVVDVSPDEIIEYSQKAEAQVALFQNNGQLTEQDMDNVNIPVSIYGKSSVPRDGRTASQRRALLLTHDDTIKNFINYKVLQELKKDKEHQKNLKIVDQENKRVQQHQEKERKKLQKIEEQEKENERKSMMSKEELNEEKKRKRAEDDQKKEKKAAKMKTEEEERNQRYQAAKLAISSKGLR
jgi:flagellar biosynthesis GTPase FlhF